jgi:hypothetical protein
MEGLYEGKASGGERSFSISEAVATIHGIMAEISPTGAVDSERSDLGLLLKMLEKGAISPLEAVKKARAMQDSRNLDH